MHRLFLIIFVMILPLTAQENNVLEAFTPEATEPSSSPEQTGLSRFGYQLFNHSLDMLEQDPVSELPDDYRLGAGDQLLVFLGDKTQQSFTVQVSSDNKIFLPTVGVIHVSGLTISAFKKNLEKQLAKYYSEFAPEIVLVVPKKIRVRVVGEVVNPGYYAASALASTIDFIGMANGLTENGSLRNIEIHRGDSLVSTIDLYDFLLRPGYFQQQILESGDQIFVPVTRESVEINGQVRRPSIYEKSSHKAETVAEMIEWAGGFTDLAFKDRIELSRLLPSGDRKMEQLASSDLSSTETRNFDRLFVYSYLDQIPAQMIHISGEVNNPGDYPFEQNITVRDLIAKAGFLTRRAYLLEAEIAKIDPQMPVRSLKIDLQKALDDSIRHNLILEADDHLFIRKKPQWIVGPLVQIDGEVMFPGKYAIVKDSTTLFDIIDQAGGFTPDALISEAKLIRSRSQAVQDKEFERLKEMTRDQMSELEYEYFVMKQNASEMQQVVVDFYELIIRKNRQEDVLLFDGDRILVPKKSDLVMVSGRVAREGGVIFKPGKGLDYYIKKAGGFTWDSNSRKTKVIKASGEIVDDEDVDVFEPGDRIWVPRKKDRTFWQTLSATITTLSQIATIYFIIRTAAND